MCAGERLKAALRHLWFCPPEPKVSFIITFFAFLFMLVSVILDRWHSWDSGHAGLWTTCNANRTQECCSHIEDVIDVPAYVDATKAFAIMGILTISYRIVMILYAIYNHHDHSDSSCLHLINNTVTSLLLLVGTIVYSASGPASYIPEDADLSVAFYFQVCSLIVTVLETALILCYVFN